MEAETESTLLTAAAKNKLFAPHLQVMLIRVSH